MEKISIIIPCFNEAKTIAINIRRVFASNTLNLEKEVIVIDDGSIDKIEKEMSKLMKEFPSLKFERNKRNHGKGYAVKRGFIKAKGDVFLIQDADLEYSPDEYPLLLRPIVDGDADVVYGSRFMGERPHRVLFFWHMVANQLLTLLSNMMTNLNLTDMETGYKVITANVARKFEICENRFGFEPEFTAKVARVGARIFEVGISYHGRSYEEGKKIDWKDGVKAVYYILKYNLVKID